MDGNFIEIYIIIIHSQPHWSSAGWQFSNTFENPQACRFLHEIFYTAMQLIFNLHKLLRMSPISQRYKFESLKPFRV